MTLRYSGIITILQMMLIKKSLKKCILNSLLWTENMIRLKMPLASLSHTCSLCWLLCLSEKSKTQIYIVEKRKPFKDTVKQFVEKSAYKELLTIENKELMNNFIQSEYIYFNNDRYIQKEVDMIFTFINEYRMILNQSYSDYKTSLLIFRQTLKER